MHIRFKTFKKVPCFTPKTAFNWTYPVTPAQQFSTYAVYFLTDAKTVQTSAKTYLLRRRGYNIYCTIPVESAGFPHSVALRSFFKTHIPINHWNYFIFQWQREVVCCLLAIRMSVFRQPPSSEAVKNKKRNNSCVKKKDRINFETFITVFSPFLDTTEFICT